MVLPARVIGQVLGEAPDFGGIPTHAEQIALRHGLLGLARKGRSGETGRGGDRKQSGNNLCSHVSNLFCGIVSIPEYAACLGGLRLNPS